MNHTHDDETTRKIAEVYSGIISDIGEDPNREGLQKTPERVAKALQFLTHGYDLDPKKILESALFHEEYSEMVIVKDIEVYSLCEHHMLPFFGKAHVAYIPDGTIVGLSKIPRVVDAFARQLQLETRQTRQDIEAARQTDIAREPTARALRSPEEERALRESATRRRQAAADRTGEIDGWLDRPGR